MELRNFVAEALTQIAQGAIDAQAQVKETGAIVNPINIVTSSKEKYSYTVTPSGDALPVQCVEFDIAITVSEETGKSGGGGIKIFAAQFDGKINTDHANKSVSRIKFPVNMILPSGQPTTKVDDSNHDNNDYDPLGRWD